MFRSNEWAMKDASKEARKLLKRSNWGISTSPLHFISKRSGLASFLLWLLLVAGETQYCWIDRLELGRLVTLAQVNSLLPAAIVGAVIPFLVLLTQISQSTRLQTVRSLTTTTVQRKTVLVPLTALAVSVAIGIAGAVYRDFDVHPITRPAARYLLLTAWYLSTLSLWLCFSFVMQSIDTLSPAKMRITLARAMRRAAYDSLASDFTYRIATSRISSTLETLRIRTFATNHHGRTRVTSTQTGVVVDVNFSRLKRATTMALPIQGDVSGSDPQIVFLANIGSRVRKGETIALLPDSLDKARNIEKLLRSAIEVTPDNQLSSSSLHRTLEEFKLEIFSAVDACNENDVRSLFAIYSEVLDAYMELQFEYSEEVARSWFDTWTFLRVLESDLNDILRRAVSVRDATFVATPLFECKRILSLALDHHESMVFETILRVFVRCFIESENAQNKRGIDRSVSYLTELVDFDIALRIDKAPPTGAANYIPFLRSIRRTLEEILRYSIQLEDVRNSRRIWDSFSKMLEFVRGDVYEEHMTDDEDAAVALRSLREFRSSHDKHVHDTQKSVISYILDLVAAEQIPAGSASELFSEFSRNLAPADVFLWASKLHATHEYPVRWQYEEFRRGVHSIDESVSPARVCVIVALGFQKGHDKPLDFGPSRFAHDRLQLLCTMAEAANISWPWALPGATDQDVANVVSSFESSAKQFTEQVHTEIAHSQISPALRDAFVQDALTEYGTGGALRTLLVRHNRISTVSDLEVEVLSDSQLAPREMFIEQDRVHYVQSGAAFIRGFAEAESNCIIRTLVAHSRSRNIDTAGSIDELCDLAISSLRDSGYDPDLLLFGHEIFRRIDLFRLEKFTEAIREDEIIPGAVGKYDNVWVCRSASISGQQILALDARCVLTVAESSRTPEIEIRDLMPEEIVCLSEAQSPNQDPRLNVIVGIRKAVRATIVEPHASMTVTRINALPPT